MIVRRNRTGFAHKLLQGVVAFALIWATRGTRADSEANLSEPPLASPTRWIILKSEPELWNEPGAGTPEGTLRLDAQSEIESTQRKIVGSGQTPWVHVRWGGQEGWLPEALLAPLPQKVTQKDLQSIGTEPVDRFFGIAPDYVPPDLTPVRHGYNPNFEYLLRTEAAAALDRMIRAARLDGLRLEIVSAYRAYETQQRIYLNKLERSGWDQRTVAKPGHSEHQLGTVVDLTGPDDKTLLRGSFGKTDEGIWLKENAPDYGFAVSYTHANSEQSGYSAEPWHYRYWGLELARKRHNAARGEEPSP